MTVSTTLMAIAALSSLAPKRIDSGIVLTLYAILAPGVPHIAVDEALWIACELVA